MPSEPGILFWHALTPLHVGTGASLSHIDLPIQREEHTRWPMIQSGGVKGALRSWYAGHPAKAKFLEIIKELWPTETPADDPQKKYTLLEEKIFGPRPQSGDEEKAAGALDITDARILLLPVASDPGVFSLVTCPLVLQEWQQNLLYTGVMAGSGTGLNFDNPEQNEALVPEEFPGGDYPLRLLELAFKVKNEPGVSQLAECFGGTLFPPGSPAAFLAKRLQNHLVIVHDEVFADLTQEATAVQTRIQLDNEKGTVKEGPWTQEFLPPHSVLYSFTNANSINGQEASLCHDFLTELLEEKGVTQIGGDKSLGKGWVQAIFCPSLSMFEMAPGSQEPLEEKS